MALLDGKNPDVVHAHYGFNGERIQILRDAGLLRCPLVVTWHGADANVFPLRFGRGIYRNLFASDALHTCGSAFMRERLIHLGADPERIRVVPIGVADSFAKIAPKSNTVPTSDYDASRPLHLLTAGRVVEGKGHNMVIEALIRLHARNIPFRWTVLGDGPLLAKLRADVAQYA